MLARREAEGGVLGQEALMGGQTAEMELLVRVVQGQFELPAPPSVSRARRLGGKPQPHLPEQLAPGKAEAVAAADPHQCLDRGALELGRCSADEIADAFERAVPFALLDRSRGGLFAPVTDESQADSESIRVPRGVAPGHATLAGFDSAPDVALIDIWESHIDSVAHGVAAERID